jgi:SAM-dependent methyltransferase
MTMPSPDLASPSRLVRVACPNCGADMPDPFAAERGFTLVRCGACRLLYVSPRLSDELIDAAVRSGVHAEEAAGLVVTARRDDGKVMRYRRLFADLFPDLWQGPSIAWLDVGAGYGEVVEAVSSLAPAGSKVRGLEPMAPKAAAARARGLDIIEAYLDPSLGPVDVLSIVDVFSHIPDFNAFLAGVRDVVPIGGSLFMETGNLADCESRSEFADELGLPDHLVFAGERHLADFLGRAGFEIRDIRRRRIDTPLFFAKTVAKKLLGRSAIVRLPYTSRYRSLCLRAQRVA